MTFKCKICGGQVTIDSNNGIVVCNYCGTKQALPLFTEDSERLLYDRGNNYLLHSEYDKAENVFNQLLTIKPDAAELYWDLVLCKYGVTYVKDPKTGKYIPTCNRTHYTPIFSDENYKKAIELSSGEKKSLFEEDAKTIDNIQKGIIAVSKKEKPFDIFISYKETDANGNRTKDSIEAQKLYEKLTEAGYKVFFSRITLEDKIGTEYEPYIYAALYSSKVMLTISSSKENLEAVWVKNEWSRFLGFRQNDNSKTLLPLYFDMDKEELPEDFALLSAYDMQTDGFADELLRGIKKLIPLPIMKAKRRKQMLKAAGIVAASFVLIAGIAAAIIIPKNIEQKRIQEEIAAKEAAYQAAITLFDNADYIEAEAAFIDLGDYKDSAHMAARCPIQPEYDAAMQLYYDGKYPQATWAFEELGDYEDAAEQKEKAALSWRKSLATVAYPGGERYDEEGMQYINTLGILSTESTPGKEEPNEHGKIVSVSEAILREDGTLFIDNKEIAQDVIQVAPILYQANDGAIYTDTVILKADGTVTSKETIENNGGIEDHSFLKWQNIVMLTSYKYAYLMSQDSVLIGVDADGNVYSCGVSYDFSVSQLDTIVGSFKNIENISVYKDNLAAITKDSKIITYINGKEATADATDIIDVSVSYSDVYVLKSDGTLYNYGTSKKLLTDVVRIFEAGHTSYAITRSGALYGIEGDEIGYKTCVYDEWLARMG